MYIDWLLLYPELFKEKMNYVMAEKKWKIVDGQVVVDLKSSRDKIIVIDPCYPTYHGVEWAITETPPCGYFFGPYNVDGVWIGPESGPNWPYPHTRLFLPSRSYKMVGGTTEILMEITKERQRQKDLAHGGDTEAFDKANSRNDWVSYITAYAGRAADKCSRNDHHSCNFRDMMKKVAALAIAAIEAHDKEWC